MKDFDSYLKKNGYCFKSATWPNNGHHAPPGVYKMTEECFTLATTGVLPGTDFHKKLTKAKELVAEGEFDKALKLKEQLSRTKVSLDRDSGWQDNSKMRAIRQKLIKGAIAAIRVSEMDRRRFKAYKSMLKKFESEKKPGNKTLCSFMERCPVSFWNGRKGSDELKTACNAAAEKYVAYMREKKKLKSSTLRKCIKQWNGLEITKTLMVEYDEKAQRSLSKITSMDDGYFKKRELQIFIEKWKFGKAVETARKALKKQA
jgi:hypothetical protein